MTTDRFGAFLANIPQATRRALEELRRRIDVQGTKIEELEQRIEALENP
jgi:hypothetical protein